MNISPSTLTAILPLALGGVFSYFKPFLEDQIEFKNRGTRIITRSSENIAAALVELLRAEIRNKDFDNMVRGDGAQSPDRYDAVANAVVRHSKFNFRVSVRLAVFRACYGILLSGMLVGLAVLIASVVTTGYETPVLAASIVTASIQVLAVVVLYTLTRRSEDDEEVL